MPTGSLPRHAVEQGHLDRASSWRLLPLRKRVVPGCKCDPFTGLSVLSRCWISTYVYLLTQQERLVRMAASLPLAQAGDRGADVRQLESAGVEQVERLQACVTGNGTWAWSVGPSLAQSTLNE